MLVDPITWAERFFFFDSSSTYQGRFQLSRAPWLGDIMLSFADPTVTSGVCRCSAQSAKTQTAMILLLWALCEDPGPTMWVLPAADEAKTFSTTRLQESILLCEPLVRLMSNKRYDFSRQEIHFASAPLLIFGAGSDSKISGKPIKYLLLDEEKNFKPGAVEKAMKRTRSNGIPRCGG
jgi:phage terminase large subunit GpA-like protein